MRIYSPVWIAIAVEIVTPMLLEDNMWCRFVAGLCLLRVSFVAAAGTVT